MRGVSPTNWPSRIINCVILALLIIYIAVPCLIYLRPCMILFQVFQRDAEAKGEPNQLAIENNQLRNTCVINHIHFCALFDLFASLLGSILGVSARCGSEGRAQPTGPRVAPGVLPWRATRRKIGTAAHFEGLADCLVNIFGYLSVYLNMSFSLAIYLYESAYSGYTSTEGSTT